MTYRPFKVDTVTQGLLREQILQLKILNTHLSLATDVQSNESMIPQEVK